MKNSFLEKETSLNQIKIFTDFGYRISFCRPQWRKEKHKFLNYVFMFKKALHLAPSAGAVRSGLRRRVRSLFFPKGFFRVFISGSCTSVIANILLPSLCLYIIPSRFSSRLGMVHLRQISSKKIDIMDLYMVTSHYSRQEYIQNMAIIRKQLVVLPHTSSS